jgi:hypothetical protein
MEIIFYIISNFLFNFFKCPYGNCVPVIVKVVPPPVPPLLTSTDVIVGVNDDL